MSRAAELTRARIRAVALSALNDLEARALAARSLRGQLWAVAGTVAAGCMMRSSRDAQQHAACASWVSVCLAFGTEAVDRAQRKRRAA